MGETLTCRPLDCSDPPSDELTADECHGKRLTGRLVLPRQFDGFPVQL